MRAPFGLSLIFLNVLLEQLGLPLPATPTLVLAGALAANGQLPASAVLALAVAASLIGDSIWYLAGRAYGVRVMKLLCRISLTPDTCVSQTQASFERWGARALIVAKFIPGLSMIAPPLAGATRMSFARFTLFSAAGAALWVGVALTAGLLLKSQIAWLLPRLAGIGGTVAVIVLVLLAAYIAFKWWERRRFYALLDMARIDVSELYERMQGDTLPVIVDVRSPTSVGLERRRIPGALQVPVQEVERHARILPRDREIILYCTCPNEASAAQAARLLISHGFRQVRPLRGGLDAWIAAGYAVEELPAAAASVATVPIAAPPLQ
ncbi:MAG: DedA family protein/thiosulfate sulfurtransferase GlpE [Gammaproteobacteria bacterium]|nr:DedA family protein/thiosulfate sulfurtransferase GlpE [Gammaproteobacteria bacterium]MBV9723621.1 DedA family protein/thiosulfate sulfurtransferase GlpE [Gammaproteobacteria bacterium]